MLRIGIDIGSTTIKTVVLDSDCKILFKDYRRHKAEIKSTLLIISDLLKSSFNSEKMSFTLTGSASMGIAESIGIPFIQEVVAASQYVKKSIPNASVLIDIGGEDTKMIFFRKNAPPDIRMNGNCAGGTGSFIDQMASLLNISHEDLDKTAKLSNHIYTIASRCGVFAKTDVQNLIARKIPIEDISASILNAIAIQTINALARGFELIPKIVLCGGPLTFISSLKEAFYNVLGNSSDDFILPEHSEILSAYGAALHRAKNPKNITIDEFKNYLNENMVIDISTDYYLSPLFENHQEFETQSLEKKLIPIPTNNYIKGCDYYLGIDSGSTTTKIILINDNKEIVYKFYSKNKGKPLETVAEGLKKLVDQTGISSKEIKYSTTTGYGEDLIHAAFNIHSGIVETIAHYKGAIELDPEVSFILDIGGQDMKAAFINNGIISNIEINEACSSGCGSFIENFAESMDYTAAEFGLAACSSKRPSDLGTRCTVFMNSRVKQSLRDGAEVGDISAGLAFSVIKNCLFKVLKIKDISVLGKNIVVQGGSFKNPAVFRAMELLCEKEIKVSDIPELMGAYGASLYALEKYRKVKQSELHTHVELNLHFNDIEEKKVVCKACSNNCVVTKFSFSEGRNHFSGNKCEKIFSSKGRIEHGKNIVDYKKKLLFERVNKLENQILKLGIPRILNFYQNYPFWHSLFMNCGIQPILSDESNHEQLNLGLGSVMSENICFPAKISHGHIIDLINKKVDRIFHPFVIFEELNITDARNSYNCPIVSGYSEVLKSSMNIEEKYSIPYDNPHINFKTKEQLFASCQAYLITLGIKKSTIKQALNIAYNDYIDYKTKIYLKSKDMFESAISENRLVAVLAMRPYQIDELIHQKVSNILTELGVDVVTEELTGFELDMGIKNAITVSQWSYPNRIFKVANFVAESKYSNILFIQLNSFGCGPDAFIIDEVQDIIKRSGKVHSLIKIDEISSTGSIRLRLRSLIESMKLHPNMNLEKIQYQTTKPFLEEDVKRTILLPFLSEYYSPSLNTVFEMLGYKVKTLPEPDKISSDLGLKYANNEVCYPATLVVGDIMKALLSGNYKNEEIAICISQTGGQCRATNYIALIKKAMVAGGYSDVPVVALASNDSLVNYQPGFKLDWLKIIKIAFSALIFGDAISKMYNASAPREVVKGESKKLKLHYIAKAQEVIKNNKINGLISLLKEAVEDFNSLIYYNESIPQIGVVGEIYVKYNYFAHYNIVEKLIEERIEPVVPQLLDFFMQLYVNIDIEDKYGIDKKSLKSKFILPVVEFLANKNIKKFEDVLSKYKFYRSSHSIREEAEEAAKLLSLLNNYGEGWLIAGEIAQFAKSGIKSAVSFQPFGCIANHIISKGIESKIKKQYPEMNILFLDFDGGSSEVNVINRLQFLIRHSFDTKQEEENVRVE